jgi:hypothetical protein
MFTRRKRGNPMTKIEKNKFSMYLSTESILDNYQTDITSRQMLKESADKFTNITKEIREKDNKYLNVKKGSTAGKDSAKDALIEELMVKVGALHILARKLGDDNLKEITDVTRSDLRELRDPELLLKAGMIHEHFKDYIEDLKKNGITDQSLIELEKAVSNYEDAINKKDAKQAESKTSRKDLSELFELADDILKNELDRSMEFVKKDNPEFYKNYKSARLIKDLAKPRTKKTMAEMKDN